jgi:hypothetical protein
MNVVFPLNALFPNVTGLRKTIVASMEHYGNSQINSWATACQFSHQVVIKGGGKNGPDQPLQTFTYQESSQNILNCFHHTKKHPMPVMYSSTLVSLEMDSQIYDSYALHHTLCENTVNFHTTKT